MMNLITQRTGLTLLLIHTKHCISQFTAILAVFFAVLLPSQNALAQESEVKKVKSEVSRFQDFIRFSFQSDDYITFTPVIDGEMLILDFDDANDINLSEVSEQSKVIRSFGASPDNRSVIIRLNRSGLKLRRFIGDNFSTGFDVYFDGDSASRKKRVVMSSSSPDGVKTADTSAKEDGDTTAVAATVEELVNQQAESKYNNIITYPLDFVGPPRIQQLFRVKEDFIGPPPTDLAKTVIYEIYKTFDDGTLKVEFIPTESGVMLMMPFKDPATVTTATYSFDDDLFSVYDLKRDVILEDIPENKFFKKIEQVKHDDVTVLKIKTKQPKGEDVSYKVLSYRDKFSWIIEFNEDIEKSDFTIKPLKIAAENNWGENRITIASSGIKGPFKIEHPKTKETLKVFTVSENGNGLLLNRQFVDLKFYPTLQGYVIFEKSDFIEYKTEDLGKVIITKLPNLEISEEIIATDFSAAEGSDEAISKTVGIFPENSIFPFPKALDAEAALARANKKLSAETTAKEEKKKEESDDEDENAEGGAEAEKITSGYILPEGVSLSDIITDYLDKIVSSPDEEKSAIKYDLARLYYANEMYPESMGVMYDILVSDPGFEDMFKINAAIYSTFFLSGKYEEAYEGFSSAVKESLNNSAYNELKLWKWASEYKLNKQNRNIEYDEIKIDFIAGFDKFMQQYPDELKYRLGILFVERQIDKKQFEEAKNTLDTITYGEIPAGVANDIKYVRAKLFEISEDYEKSNEIYEELANDVEDRRNRAKAIFALTKYKLVHGLIDVQEAIEQFLYTSTIWRDEYFEMDAMEAVGNLYLQQEQYAEALSTWKSLVLNFPQTTESVFVLGKMKDVFIDLFDKGIAYKMEPLEALKLYFKFRELVPVGEVGDRITRKIAQFFISADMIEDAIEIIKHQINFRSKGENKAKLVLWLSGIYLENQKEEEAEKIFETLEQDNLSKETKELIKVAMAMSKAKRGMYYEALDMVKGGDSFDDNSVKLELFWLRKNWFGIIDIVEGREEAYEETLPNAFTKAELGDMMKAAVAYSAQGLDDKLLALSEKYRPRMEGEEHLKIFDYLVQGSEKLDYQNFDKTLELDKLEDFLINYSFMDNKDWENTIEILEPKVAELVGTPEDSLTAENKMDVVKLALGYSLYDPEEDRFKKEAEKKLAGLARDFRSVRVDRFTIAAFKVLDSKTTPLENDAIFEGKIKMMDIPRFVPFYKAARKISEMNISIRGKFD